MRSHLLRHLPEELKKNILADGEVLHVKMADGQLPPAHRAGWRVPGGTKDSAKKAERAALYSAYDADVGAAWKGGQSPKVGTVCTVKGGRYKSAFGSPGTWQEVDGELECVPDAAGPRSFDAARPQDAKAIRDAAYESYESDLVNAWKKGPDEQRYGDAKPRTATDARTTDLKTLYAQRDAEISNAWRRG